MGDQYDSSLHERDSDPSASDRRSIARRWNAILDKDGVFEVAIDNRVAQVFERIRNDSELRRQLAQLLFGRESLQLSDQVGYVVDVMRQLAETVQQGFRISGELLALLEE